MLSPLTISSLDWLWALAVEAPFTFIYGWLIPPTITFLPLTILGVKINLVVPVISPPIVKQILLSKYSSPPPLKFPVISSLLESFKPLSSGTDIFSTSLSPLSIIT